MTLQELGTPFAGQGWVQVGELLLAFALGSLVGLERQLRRKSAGLRTQAIVCTASALTLIVSKYGFSDVLISGHIVLDPSRVAAQIVSGVGFLGAGIILTRRGTVRGLTTAAAVWETAAIGMAAGAGLWLLALVVTALHFVIVYGYTSLMRRFEASAEHTVLLDVVYESGRGVLPDILARVTEVGWRLGSVQRRESGEDHETTLRLELTGRGGDTGPLVGGIAGVHGVRDVDPSVGDELE